LCIQGFVQYLSGKPLVIIGGFQTFLVGLVTGSMMVGSFLTEKIQAQRPNFAQNLPYLSAQRAPFPRGTQMGMQTDLTTLKNASDFDRVFMAQMIPPPSNGGDDVKYDFE
jgi:hypothetical protein